jgi:hypothetical protein
MSETHLLRGRRTIALCVLEMTRGRGFAPSVRAANEWMRGTVAKGRIGVWNPALGIVN